MVIEGIKFHVILGILEPVHLDFHASGTELFFLFSFLCYVVSRSQMYLTLNVSTAPFVEIGKKIIF